MAGPGEQDPTTPERRTLTGPEPEVARTLTDPLLLTKRQRPGGGKPASPPVAVLPELNAFLGPYQIKRELGKGGMGVVYEARDTKLSRTVAIKFLYGDLQPNDPPRFLREARALARCHHENIVVIYEVNEHKVGNHRSLYMVLEHLRGGPLTRLMPLGRQLSAARAVELIVPVVRALVHAHSLGIVHRDLKPDNIYVTDEDVIKVLDFGIAKLVHGENEFGRGTGPLAVVTPGSSLMAAVTTDADAKELTRRGALMGTLRFMSPEQWMAAGIDHQTDLWSVGVILYRMVTGAYPLGRLEGMALQVTADLAQPMPSVRGARPDLSDELVTIIDGCLRKKKADRIASAYELLKLLELLLPGRRPLRPDESPYAGLNSFQETDAHRFFGRTREIGTAVARLRDVPVLCVLGPTGIGKSSFVRAGVVPALKASGEKWETLILRPGRSPLAALAYALAPRVSDALIGVSADRSRHQALLEKLEAEPGFFGAALRDRGEHTLVFVDQFEELYTQGADEDARRAFTACLASVCDDAGAPLRLVVSLRSDFLDHVAEDPVLLAELTRGLFVLTAPDRNGLREALIQPAELAGGYRFDDPELVKSMVNHLEHTPGALPLLSFTASKLWELRDPERRLLTVDSYTEIGGIAGALASHADTVLAGCTSREQTLVRSLVLRLVTSERTRALVPVSELYELSRDPSEVHRVVDRLVSSRLVVGQTTVGESGSTAAGGAVELVHESLIHSWPRLQKWLEETAGDSAFLEQLRGAAGNWEVKGYPQGLLWRGEAVGEAQRWRSRYRGELTRLERAYLDAVFALEAKATRRKRLAFIAVTVTLSLIAIGAIVALLMIRDAERATAAQLQRTQRAEVVAQDERANAIQAADKLKHQNAALVAATAAAQQAQRDSESARVEAERAGAEAEAARQRAEQAKRYERQSKQRATAAAQIAREAAADAKRAGEKLELLLATERKRVRELEALTRGATIVPEPDVQPR